MSRPRHPSLSHRRTRSEASSATQSSSRSTRASLRRESPPPPLPLDEGIYRTHFVPRKTSSSITSTISPTSPGSRARRSRLTQSTDRDSIELTRTRINELYSKYDTGASGEAIQWSPQSMASSLPSPPLRPPRRVYSHMLRPSIDERSGGVSPAPNALAGSTEALVRRDDGLPHPWSYQERFLHRNDGMSEARNTVHDGTRSNAGSRSASHSGSGSTTLASSAGTTKHSSLPRKKVPSYDDSFTTPPLRSPTHGPPIVPNPMIKSPPEAPQRSALRPVKPSLRAVFTLAPMRSRLLVLIPAILFTCIVAMVAPFMTTLVGDTFIALAEFPRDHTTATEEDKRKLMSAVSTASLKFFFCGVVAWGIGYLKTVCWMIYAEHTTARLRVKIYEGVERKPMEWFDLGMGMKEGGAGGEGVGAGGLMSKFGRESEDVRTAIIMTPAIVQSIITFLACFILAMLKVPLLAIVILSSAPILALVSYVTAKVAEPMYIVERHGFAQASTNVERVTTAIATVKAHNAQANEHERFMRWINVARDSLLKQSFVWATNFGISDLTTLSMFVVGFWYGAKLIYDGKANVAEVMVVFWACLIGSGGLQMVPPMFAMLDKGKTSLASLLSLIQDDPYSLEPKNRDWLSGSTAVTNKDVYSSRPLVVPDRCFGAVDFQDVAFAYPTRPDVPILRGLSLWVAAGEMTFIVGGSGSGKSTVAQLLLGLYSPGSGNIIFDERLFDEYDPKYKCESIAAVQQGCVTFDMSVHDNVAMGIIGSGLDLKKDSFGKVRTPKDITRDEVVEACQTACIHEFIMSLPQGYDTMLGTNGSQLSGGQRQRLAIARSRIRNPPVLILDEATSALDATSRVEVFEAIRKWRTNSTTIVITHDLSQIQAGDFAYVMKHGVIAEQGYREDLVRNGGIFAAMAAEQAVEPLPVKNAPDWIDLSTVAPVLEAENDMHADARSQYNPRHSMAVDDYMDIIEDHLPAAISKRLTYRPRVQQGPHSRPVSRPASLALSGDWRSYQDLTEGPKKRHSNYPNRDTIQVVTKQPSHESLKPERQRKNIFGLLRYYFPTIPTKPVFFLGVIFSAGHGIATPVWSFYFAKLLALLGGPMGPVSKQAGYLIVISASQAAAYWLKHYLMSSLAARWTANLRDTAFEKVLAQDKAWFDETAHAPPRLIQGVIKDVDDIRSLLAMVVPQAVVVILMVSLGLIWAMAVGWQLTLVGLGLAPVLGLLVVMSNHFAAKADAYTKMKREAVSSTFHESIANVRGIRSIALDSHFHDTFVRQTEDARRYASKAAWSIAIGLSAGAAMPMFAQSLMNYTGAIFVSMGIMSYPSMLQVYTLVLFSVTSGTQMLSFMTLLTKASVASRDFEQLLELSTNTAEIKGEVRAPITGHIAFENVHFAYPTRPDAPVLKGLTLRLEPGECVAVVGPSGSGKSTIAALLQRLYEPTRGHIMLSNRYNLGSMDVKWIRSKLAVVSQTANLFDASVAENIAYGSHVAPETIRQAARDAHIHDFIMSLPQGYETNLGENASCMSGGQNQRLQIARALARSANILILDECTSALDPDNARAVLDTIVSIKDSHTVVFITHSAEAMRRCDRVVCLGDGQIAEQGTFDELIARGGVFAQLMKAGEWE